MEKKCSNCKHFKWRTWDGYDYCLDYIMDTYESATECERYEYKEWESENEDEYTPSATRGDYSPSCPWNAPGMSIKDFI